MKKFEGILFASDLDGTLLRDDKTLSEENLKAIEYFKENGGYFTVVTGRPAVIVGDIYNKIRPNAPMSCYNGGGIYDAGKKEFLWKNRKDLMKRKIHCFITSEMMKIIFRKSRKKQQRETTLLP